MKRFISIFLCIMMVVTAFVFAGCESENTAYGINKGDSYKLGMGVYSYVKEAANADGDTNGKGEVVTTVAAVILNSDDVIIDCTIDVADSTVEWTSAGTAVEAGEFKTKLELGADYGMAAYGTDVNGDGIVKEWYEQIDAFCATVVTKKLDEVKALVAEDGYYGVEEVVSAGCTIGVSDYVKAIEKAVANAADCEFEGKDNGHNGLQIGIVTVADGVDATEEAGGTYEVVSTVSAVVLNTDNTVLASASDAIQVDFAFDLAGASETDTEAELSTKKEAGENYGMATYGTDLNGDGVVKEWNEQAAAFDAACEGKTASEISALVAEDGYYGVEELATAGCTIGVSDLVKATVKAATAKAEA